MSYDPLIFPRGNTKELTATITMSDGTQQTITDFFIFGKVVDMEKDLTEEEKRISKEEEKDTAFFSAIKMEPFSVGHMMVVLGRAAGDQFIQAVTIGIEMYEEYKAGKL